MIRGLFALLLCIPLQLSHAAGTKMPSQAPSSSLCQTQALAAVAANFPPLISPKAKLVVIVLADAALGSAVTTVMVHVFRNPAGFHPPEITMERTRALLAVVASASLIWKGAGVAFLSLLWWLNARSRAIPNAVRSRRQALLMLAAAVWAGWAAVPPVNDRPPIKDKTLEAITQQLEKADRNYNRAVDDFCKRGETITDPHALMEKTFAPAVRSIVERYGHPNQIPELQRGMNLEALLDALTPYYERNGFNLFARFFSVRAHEHVYPRLLDLGLYPITTLPADSRPTMPALPIVARIVAVDGPARIEPFSDSMQLENHRIRIAYSGDAREIVVDMSVIREDAKAIWSHALTYAERSDDDLAADEASAVRDGRYEDGVAMLSARLYRRQFGKALRQSLEGFTKAASASIIRWRLWEEIQRLEDREAVAELQSLPEENRDMFVEANAGLTGLINGQAPYLAAEELLGWAAGTNGDNPEMALVHQGVSQVILQTFREELRDHPQQYPSANTREPRAGNELTKMYFYLSQIPRLSIDDVTNAYRQVQKDLKQDEQKGRSPAMLVPPALRPSPPHAVDYRLHLAA